MMKNILRISLSKILCIIILICCIAENAKATVLGGEGSCPDDLFNSPREEKDIDSKGLAPNAPPEAKQYYDKYLDALVDLEMLCKEACKDETLYCTDGDQREYMNKHNLTTKYNNLLKDLKAYKKSLKDIPLNNPCGDEYPYGCPDDMSCHEVNTSYSTEYSDITMRSYTCKVKDGGGLEWGSSHEVEESQVGSVVMSVSGPTAISSVVDSNGESHIKSFSLSDGFEGLDEFNRTGYYEPDDPRSNKSCKIDDLAQKYMKNCYSCVIVSALINTFMRVAYTAEGLMQTAGIKLLVMGMFLWIAFYVLKKLSSFTSLEPMKMVQELFTFFFKCVVAFVFITSGLKVISEYFVNPILIAGADYGIGIIDSVMPENITLNGKTKTYEMDNKINLVAKASIDQKVFDKIMTISKRADAATSLNFVIGNALICHSTHAGAIQLFKKITEMIGIKIFIPDFWLMLAGALIWFFAFMVTMAVNFYLLDLSFKIGFALLALPVCIGLWPFEKFKDKFVICLKIIINAAGTFLFLGITTGLSIVLISKSLHGTDELLERMKADDAEYVSRVFGFTSGAFLLVLFAYLYSHKLISETVSKLADKFFEATTNGLNPIHKKTTQAIDFVKKQAGNVAGMVANPVKGGMTDMMKGGATKLARGAIDKARSGFRGLTGGDE